MIRKLSEIEIQRRKKVEKLKALNIEPFSRDIAFSHSSKKLQIEFAKYSKKELEKLNTNVSIVFRIMIIRGPFLVGQDAFGKLQTYVGREIDQNSFVVKKLLDIGDIIKVSGLIMKTNTGELTIKAKNIKIITKSLKQLPEKFHGLKDVEKRYRRRYIDLIVNKESKELFWKRTKIISAIRNFFDQLGFMEAETPILTPILGGAAARPFKTHHNALNMPLYLRVATELHLKRLLVGGIEKVYEIGRLFRNEGISTSHNPEFTTIEFYESYSNLEGMIKRTEELLIHISKTINKPSVNVNGNEIALKRPFRRIDMVEAVSKATNSNMKTITFSDAKKRAIKYGIEVKSYFKVGHIINELFEKLIEKNIIEPTFVYGHPVEVSPFAAKSKSDPRFTERAELFIGACEYANMFTELNDPIDQYNRFKEQLNEANAGNDEANELDIDFIESLEYGMPPAGGCGIGIDRLIMLFTGKTSIREVLLFPHLKARKQKEPKNE